MIILFRLIVAHLLANFLLFPTSWGKKKQQYQLRSTFFYLHGAIYALTAYVLLGVWSNWQVPLFIGVMHLCIDYWKINSKESTLNFILDQLFHFMALFLAWLYILGDIEALGAIIKAFFDQENIWVLTMGYLVVIWPMRYIIALATQRWRKEVHNEGLMDAGKWIGQIERILILTFVFINKFEAIGFLITAKSIFRFSEINKERKEAEYILIGTLLSFALSIVWGLLLKLLL